MSIESNARRIESNARVAESDDEILESVHACLHLLVEVSFLCIYCAAVGRTGTAGDGAPPAAGLSLASRSCVSSLWREIVPYKGVYILHVLFHKRLKHSTLEPCA